MMENSAPLGDITPDRFIAEYWQKAPLLIRQAFPNFESPLEANELAGLACREDVFSRLILEKGGSHPWQVVPGPVDPERFETLGDSHWTVLVQEVDRHVPEVADLFDRFSFLPEWRKDDVMVSFASNNAGVGPHTDSYDVFLLQGTGRRRWEIGEVREYRERQGLDIRMIEDFVPTEVFELEPGDMLYLPPGVPHNGVALEPCLTYSFGFLAPTQAELMIDFAPWYESKMGVRRFADPDLLPPNRRGLLTEEDLNRVLRLLREGPIDREVLAEWFGMMITRPQRAPAECEEQEGSFEDFQSDFQQCDLWRRHEGIRLLGWLGEAPQLFVDGLCWPEPLPREVIETVSSRRSFTYREVSEQPELLELLYELFQRGYGYFPDEGDDEDEDE